MRSTLTYSDMKALLELPDKLYYYDYSEVIFECVGDLVVTQIISGEKSFTNAGN